MKLTLRKTILPFQTTLSCRLAGSRSTTGPCGRRLGNPETSVPQPQPFASGLGTSSFLVHLAQGCSFYKHPEGISTTRISDFIASFLMGKLACDEGKPVGIGYIQSTSFI